MARQKTGGRKKNTPNKLTTDLRKVLEEFVSDYYNSGLAESDFANMTARDRLDVVIKMLAFELPKPSAVVVATHKFHKTAAIEQELRRLCGDPEN